MNREIVPEKYFCKGKCMGLYMSLELGLNPYVSEKFKIGVRTAMHSNGVIYLKDRNMQTGYSIYEVLIYLGHSPNIMKEDLDDSLNATCFNLTSDEIKLFQKMEGDLTDAVKARMNQIVGDVKYSVKRIGFVSAQPCDENGDDVFVSIPTPSKFDMERRSSGAKLEESTRDNLSNLSGKIFAQQRDHYKKKEEQLQKQHEEREEEFKKRHEEREVEFKERLAMKEKEHERQLAEKNQEIDELRSLLAKRKREHEGEDDDEEEEEEDINEYEKPMKKRKIDDD